LRTLTDEIPIAPDLVVEEVLTEARLRHWANTTYCGAPPEAIQCVFTAHAGLPHGPGSAIRLYLGTQEGEPVATVKLFFAAGVAYIGRVVTVHAARRQGICTAMTMRALRIAREEGYRIAVLTASPMGISIYRRLGFQECCVVSTYAWDPAR
jgi:GNAT superfamily N-acetyltransferase